MRDGEFEWADAKAALNRQNHGVTFEMARAAFSDAFAVEWQDDAQDAAEPRIVMLGMVEHRLLFVAYTVRKNRIRIISARRAEPHERRRYHDENRET
ncbi:MAG TPA: BrnT family toxin [Acetobacteraceae bacterium]|nr:BrnT family toxin [Acetobacteraceae bacterium]